MEIKLSKTEWAFGLFQYPPTPPEPSQFLEFYERVLMLLDEVKAPPTFIAAEGNGYSGELMRFGGSVTKRLVDSGFEGISVLSIVTNPPGSKEPSYDRSVSASLSLNAPNEVLLCMVMNDSVLPFGSDRFRRLVVDLVGMRSWAFGFAFQDLVIRQPDFHILSLDNGKLSKEERKALMLWYGSKAELRRQKLRGIYPLSVLNKEQLQQPVSANQSLGDFIKSNPAFRVENVRGLMILEIPTSEVEPTKERLRNSPAMIS